MSQYGKPRSKQTLGPIVLVAALFLTGNACTDVTKGSSSTDTFSEMDSGVGTKSDTVGVTDVSSDVSSDAASIEDTASQGDGTSQDASTQTDIEPDPSCEEGEGCFEELCESAEDCLSEICTMHMGDNVCSKTCDVTCPAGWNCKLITTNSDSQYVCVSKVTHLCFPCDNDMECSDVGSINACVSYGDAGWFCGASCKEADDCPAGYSCTEAATRDGGTSKQCIADAGVCECSQLAIDTSQSTACSVSNDDGTCEGVRTCTAEGLTACDAAPPSAEVCNGIDDNCDGAIDDVPCDDGNPCTEDTCAGEAGCTSKPSPGTACDDGDANTGGDTCTDEGLCVGKPILCQEGPCVVSATPDGDECVQVFAEAGSLCDDGFDDTKNDVCDGGAMCAGTPYSCPKATACIPSHTQDGAGCNPVYAEQGTQCDDGDPATATDVCDGNGFCSGTPFGCPQTTQCTPSYMQDGGDCKPVYALQGTKCSDGDAGTMDDTCDGSGACSGTPFDCPEPTTCSPTYIQDGETCKPIFAAQGVPCEDGDVSTKTDECNGNGSCQGTPYTCPETDICTPSYSQDGAGCLANYANQGTPCNDKDPTTKNDVCNGNGQCAGSEFGCPQPTPCIVDYVKEGDGCTPKFASQGVACNDGDVTTKNDSCNGNGTCQGTPFSCPAPTSCTPGYTQDGASCIANYAGPGTACNDQNPTTKNDVCNGGGQCSGTPYNCNGEATSVCTPTYSQDGFGCSPNHAPFGTNCNDGSNGTKNDQCNGSGSCVGQPINCPGPSVCTPSYTKDGSGCVPNHAFFGTPCNDGNNGTYGDKCNGSGSCGGSPCNVSGSTSDELGIYQTNMVLVYGNGKIVWDMTLLSSAKLAIATAIKNVYIAETGRNPDQGGLNYWVGDYINSCNKQPACNPATAKAIVDWNAFAGVKNAIEYSASIGEANWGGVTTMTHCEAKEKGY